METCLLSPVGYPTSPAGVEGRWGRGGRETQLNQPVVPALRPTCQQASDSCFLFHSLSQSLSGFTFPSLPLPLYLSSPIYLSASQPLYPFTLLHFQLYKTNNSHLSRYACLRLSVISTSQQIMGNNFGHWTQGSYLSWQPLICLKTQ